MKLRTVITLQLAAIGSACSTAVPEIDFCEVLTAAGKFEGRTFKTEIVAIPDYHGRFATDFQCEGRAIRFVDSSFKGAPQLQKFDDEMERAYSTREGRLPWKGVAVRVTARVEKFSPPLPVYMLRLLDARDWKMVDIPSEVVHPPGGDKVPGL